MSGREQDSSSKSLDIHQQLQEALARIAQLETQLLEEKKRTEAALHESEQRHQAEETTRQYARRIEILRQIDLGIINADSTQQIIETALKHIRQMIPCQRANVSLIDMAKQELVIFVVDSNKETSLGQGVRVPMQKNFFDGIDTRKLRVIEDMRLLQLSTPLLQKGIDEGLLSALNIILMDRDKPIGTLWLFANTTNYFTSEHQEIVVEVGNQLAIALRQQQLTEELAQHAAELEQKVSERTLELQVGKAKVEAILDNSTYGILLINADLSIQQTNSAFHNMFGCTPQGCHNNSLLSFIHQEHKEAVARLIEKVIEERAGQRTEVRLIRKDETSFEAELSVELIVGDGLVCTIQDITERKAGERQLRYYASIQESVSDAVIATDMNFYIQSWNPAAERIYG